MAGRGPPAAGQPCETGPCVFQSAAVIGRHREEHDVERVCDQVIVLNQGKVARAGPIRELPRAFAPKVHWREPCWTSPEGEAPCSSD